VDTYCCDSACGASCMACDVAGSEGKCTAVASGAPHGMRTACAAAMCSGTDKLIAPSTCQAGSCSTPAAQSCANSYACSAGTCKTTCSSNADCQSGTFCASGSCYPIVPIAIATGRLHACALLSSGSVRCWGDNTYSQLGNSTVVGGSFKPVAVIGLSDAIQIAAGTDDTCVVLKDATIRCWGKNDSGQLGTGSSGNPSATPLTATGGTGAVSVSVGEQHACAVVAGGKVACWGEGPTVGNGASPPFSATAPIVLNGLSGVGSLSVSPRHTCAITGDGVWCWGYNDSGQLGTDPAVSPATSVPAKSGVNAFTPRAVATGMVFSCAVQFDRTVLCWGYDPARTPDANSWKAAAVAGASNVDAVAAGQSTLRWACALSGGRVSCWGDNSYSQLGLNPNQTRMTSTLSMVPSLTGVSAISAGTSFACALTTGNKVMCWGDNTAGQIGLDPSGPPSPEGMPPNASYTPVQVSGW
jgi:alpha-tubulin suppressor-like RCC1 family protein